MSGADGAVETSRVPGGVERGPWRVRPVRGLSLHQLLMSQKIPFRLGPENLNTCRKEPQMKLKP